MNLSTRTRGDSEADLRTQVYLPSDVKLEPLCCGWYAYPNLVAPAQLAFNLAFRFVPMLESFLRNPRVHEVASRDPNMLGGPFINVPRERLDEVRCLLDTTRDRAAGLLAFAHSYRALDEKLQVGADAACLDRFYEDLPSEISGLLEIVYDSNHYALIRLIEPLLYAGGLDYARTHSIMAHRVPDRLREMFISTPNLPAADRIEFRLSFRDPRIDLLSALKHQGVSLGAIRDMSLAAAGEEGWRKLETWLTHERPQRREPAYHGQGVRVRYFGHACVLLQTAEVSILVDPLLALERNTPETLTFDDLPDEIDYIVISHAHPDHLLPEVLLQLRRRAKQIVIPGNQKGNIVDPSLQLIMRELGYENIRVVEPLDRIPIPGGWILSLPFSGEHCGLDIGAKQAVAVSLKDRSFVLLVDSEGVDPGLYGRLAPFVPPADLLFLGMECHGAPASWSYAPMMTKPIPRAADLTRRASGANNKRAWDIIQHLPSAEVCVYAMGMEPWARYLLGLEYAPESIQMQESDAFISQCRGAGMRASRLNGSREWLFG
ncbi:MAG TPA: MBL fold metallo-hydrolase [Rhizomicrobium sp.]